MSVRFSSLRVSRAFTTIAAVLAVAAGLLVAITVTTSPSADADTSPGVGTGYPATVSADALPTMQVNGVVFGSAIVGNTVYVTGSFNYARPYGQALSPTHVGETPVGDIAAYNLTTGKMITSFIHTLDNTGRTITASPDGKRIYVGGEFTHVDGATHNHIVAFLTATGAVDKTFQASVGSTVTAIAPTNSVVYVGGSFPGAANNIPRSNLAAFDTLGRLTSWHPITTGGFVESMVLTPDKTRVIVGGHFSYLNSTWAPGSGSIDAITGATMPWALNARLFDYDADGWIDGLSTDGTLIYGAGVAATFDPNDFEGRFGADPDTGAIVWADTCYGDSYDTLPVGKVLYNVTKADANKTITNTVVASAIDLDGATVMSYETSTAVKVGRAQAGSSRLAVTATESRLVLILAATLVAVGGLFVLAGKGRRRTS